MYESTDRKVRKTNWNFSFVFFVIFGVGCSTASSQPESSKTTTNAGIYMPAVNYPWFTGEFDTVSTIYYRFDAPEGCSHVPVQSGSFGEWLRFLPLHPEEHKVMLYNGDEKNRQDVHSAVINIDVGNKDLQQCADAVMRLRSEYLFSNGKYASIHFNYTSGDKCDYTEWSNGIRLRVEGNKVRQEQTSQKSSLSDRKNFASYLQNAFTYAGSLSLSREMKPVPLDSMQIGDVFIFGGTPGHAVIVVDMSQNASGTEKYFMIAQSYMPAQEIHILKNLNNKNLSPWYPLHFGDVLETPEWDFRKTELMRFVEK